MAVINVKRQRIAATGTYLEMARVFGLIAVIDSAGLMLALISEIVGNFVTFRSATVEPGILFFGALLGHFCNVVVFPCLWFKNLNVALPLAFGPAVLVAGFAPFAFPPASSVLVAAFTFCLGSIVIAFTLPRYYDVLRTGLCAECGYNLLANTTGICPECGTLRERR